MEGTVRALLLCILFSSLCLAIPYVPPKNTTVNKPKHNCIHDQMMNGVQIQPVTGLFTTANPSPDDLGKRRQATPESMRFFFNTDALDTDQGLCTQAGQWRALGNAPGTETTHTPECPASGCSGSCNCWFQCTDADVLTPAKKAFLISKVIPDVKSHFSEALNLYRIQGNLILNTTANQCACSSGGVSIPPAYKSTGVPDADFIVFLSARTTRLLGNTIAYACPCLDDAATRRPIAGYINWGPNQIDENIYAYPEQLGVGIHELTHALGFTKSKYSFYNSPSGNAVSIQNATLQGDGLTETVTLIITPKVVEIARAYYNCPSMVGVELENGGSSGTAASHWERRLLFNEYMTGYSSYDPVYSIFTLALFEDMGWYMPNYNSSGDFQWGKGAGCSFVMDRCNKRSDPYNCDANLKDQDEGCTFDRKKKGKCNLATYTANLPAFFQYYSDPKVGGRDDLADYCGFYRYSSSWRGDCTISDYNTPGQDYYNVVNYGEHYCPTCRCIDVEPSNAVDVKAPSCHNMTCLNNRILKVKIGQIWYDCGVDGQKIFLTEGFEGDYVCPTQLSKWCAQAPQEDTWPTFVSITPKQGEVGDSITVVGSGFPDSSVSVTLGLDFGCNSPKTTFDAATGTVTVNCLVGVVEDANTLRGDKKVDVVMTDSRGRTATSFKDFTISSAVTTFANVVLLVVAMLFLSL